MGDSARALTVGDFNQDGNDDVAIVQNKDTDNAQIGLSSNTGTLTFTTYTAGTKAYAVAPVRFQSASKTINLLVGDQNLSNNIQGCSSKSPGTQGGCPHG